MDPGGISNITALYWLAAVGFLLICASLTVGAYAVGMLRGAHRSSERVVVFAKRLEQVEANDDSRNRAVNESLEQMDASTDRNERKRASAASAASKLAAAGGESPPDAADAVPLTDQEIRSELARRPIRGVGAISRR